MSIAARWANVAGRFAATVAAVPADAWDRPAPCEGWVARDVVGHLVGWVPGLLDTGASIAVPAGPSVDADPLGAWTNLQAAIQAVLDDPEACAATFSHPQAGTHRVDDAISMFVLGDVLVHTWDLARATGLDERLDPDEVHGMRVGLEGLGDLLSQSGHYAPIVPVAGDADEQTRLLALTGRRA